MTPEDTVREALNYLPDSETAELFKGTDALDALVAERDALAARLAEAERVWFNRQENALARAEAAEARVAALTAAVVAECVDDLSVPCDCDEDAICLAHRVLAALATAAADRPEPCPCVNPCPSHPHCGRTYTGGSLVNPVRADPEAEAFLGRLAAADRPEGTTGETWFAGTPPHLRSSGGSCTCGNTYRGDGTDLGRSRCPIHGRATTPQEGDA